MASKLEYVASWPGSSQHNHRTRRFRKFFWLTQPVQCQQKVCAVNTTSRLPPPAQYQQKVCLVNTSHPTQCPTPCQRCINTAAVVCLHWCPTSELCSWARVAQCLHRCSVARVLLLRAGPLTHGRGLVLAVEYVCDAGDLRVAALALGRRRAVHRVVHHVA